MGSYYNNSDFKTKTLAERWNVAKWTVVPTPSFGPGISGGMAEVWCDSAADCLGVGSHDSNKTFLAGPLAEHWNGKRWASQPIPNPYPKQETGLYGLGCGSPSACEAAGNATHSVIFAERWDGQRWTTQTTPVPPGRVGPR